jgi:hypothetical protein
MLINLKALAHLNEHKGKISRMIESLRLGYWLGANFLGENDVVKKHIKKILDTNTERVGLKFYFLKYLLFC